MGINNLEYKKFVSSVARYCQALFNQKRGQLMLITVFILGGTMIGATLIAGLITTYRIRQSADVKDSVRAIFAADAGLERALFQCFKQAVPDCNNFGPIALSNGATYEVFFSLGGSVQEVRSVGKSGRSARALRFVF